MSIPVASFAPTPSASGPSASPSGSATPGQAGSFAAKLEAATNQNNGSARTGAKQQVNPARNGGPSAAPVPKGGNSEGLTEAGLEAGLNAAAGAAMQQTAATMVTLPTEATAGESAVSRLLNQLTGSATAPSTPGSGDSAAGERRLASAETGPAASQSTRGPADDALAADHPDRFKPGSNAENRRNVAGHNAAPSIDARFAAAENGARQGRRTAEQVLGLAPQPAATATTPPPQSTTAAAIETVTVQSASGQTFTISQGTAVLEEATTEESKPGAAVPMESQRLDINGNYIRSRLPSKPENNNSQDSGGRFQEAMSQSRHQEAAANNNQNGPTQATFEQQATHSQQTVFGQETQPLVFSQQQNPTPPLAVNSPVAPASAYHLPSGLVVPDGAVVDQVIAHFSVNRRLETGTVNLKLHPQELGELRMEIKVEQDNIKAHIIAQNPQAQEMIDRHLPRLREALAQQGLHLQQVEVTVATHDHTGREQMQDNRSWQQGKPVPQRPGIEQPVFSLEPDEADGGGQAAATTLSVHA